MFPFSWPRLYPAEFPKSEYEVIDHLSLIIPQPASYVDAFRTALALFEYCEAERLSPPFGYKPEDDTAKVWLSERNNTFFRWQLVAARDGAMSVFQFAESIKYIKAGVHKAPSLSILIDNTGLKRANKLFRTHFPRFEGIRHAVAHSAELVKTRSHLRKNAAGQLFIQNSLNGRHFQNTYEGKILSYEVSHETLNQLTLVLEEFYRAFHRVDGYVRPKTSKHPKP